MFNYFFQYILFSLSLPFPLMFVYFVLCFHAIFLFSVFPTYTSLLLKRKLFIHIICYTYCLVFHCIFIFLNVIHPIRQFHKTSFNVITFYECMFSCATYSIFQNFIIEHKLISSHFSNDCGTCLGHFFMFCNSSDGSDISKMSSATRR